MSSLCQYFSGSFILISGFSAAHEIKDLAITDSSRMLSITSSLRDFEVSINVATSIPK